LPGWLGALCRIAARLLERAYGEALPGAKPALILFVQTFGDLVNFNPHVHVLAADGAFVHEGRFIALPAVPQALLAEGFRRVVLEFLVKNEVIPDALRNRMLAWRHHFGFPAHNEVRIAAADAEGRKKLAGHMLRAPAALEKMAYDEASGSVIYRSKMHAGTALPAPSEAPSTEFAARAKAPWARVIRRILEHLGQWAPQASERSPPLDASAWPGSASVPGQGSNG